MTDHESFDTDNGDELQSQLHNLADAVPVGPSDGLAPAARHAQRVKRGRIGAATLAAVALGAAAITVTRGGPGDAGVVVAAADQTASVAAESTDPISFSQRTVDGLVSYPTSAVQAADGTLYVLSTSPGSRWPTDAEMAQNPDVDWFSNIPQAIYSTIDGEAWTITELGDRKFTQLSVTGNLLYSLSTTEGADGVVTAEYLTSADGGKSWDGTALPFGPVAPAEGLGDHATAYTSYQLVTSDTVQLAIRNSYWDLDYEWLNAQFVLGENQWPEIVGDKVVVRDWSQCNAYYEAIAADQEQQVAALIASGMTEDDARISVYGDGGWSGYGATTTMVYREGAQEEVIDAVEPAADSASTTSVPITTIPAADEPVSEEPTSPPTTSLQTTGDDLTGSETTFMLGDSNNYVEPPECADPPILQEKTLAELGIAGFTGGGQTTISVLRSTDGMQWAPVDAPGDYIYAAGAVFLSEKYPVNAISGTTETTIADDSAYWAPTTYVSSDGISWTETDSAEQRYNREMKASLNGQFTSFSVQYDETDSADQATYVSHGQLIFGRSSDGISWTDTVVAEFTDTGSASTWPVVQEVGPLGALVVLQHSDYTQQSDEFSYDQYLDSVVYTVRYSEDGVTWQTIDIELPSRSQISWGFVTGDAIGLTYQTGIGQGSGQTKTSTILLTPER